jgi:hypothetical protein
MLELGSHQKIADEPCVSRYFNAHRIVDCPHRGQSMRVRSDAAGALHKVMGIPGIAAL